MNRPAVRLVSALCLSIILVSAILVVAHAQWATPEESKIRVYGHVTVRMEDGTKVTKESMQVRIISSENRRKDDIVDVATVTVNGLGNWWYDNAPGGTYYSAYIMCGGSASKNASWVRVPENSKGRRVQYKINIPKLVVK